MQRRKFIAGIILCVGAGGAVDALAHTPYNQWRVYRRKHLLIGCHKDSEPTYTLAKNVVSVLEQHLPTASARVARAPTVQRIASLMATDQMDVAVLHPQHAADMALGQGEFKPYGKIDLAALLQINDLAMICRADIPDHHAWMITDALLGEFPTTASQHHTQTLALHRGARLRHDGKPIPE